MGRTPHALVRSMKRTILWGLGLLWLADTLLQAQPRMFTFDFVSDIMKPSIAVSPDFLTNLSSWAINTVTPYIGVLNWLFIAIQGTIAGLLLLGLIWQRERLVVAGLILSIAWTFPVWVVGEGTSGVFTGSATMLTGAPGSVLCYGLLAVFCLLPDRYWDISRRFCLPRDALAVIFLLGAAAQILTPAYWGEDGIPSLLQGQAAMAPSWMAPSLRAGVMATRHVPGLWNAALAVSLAACGALLIGRKPRRAGFVLLCVVLAVLWYWGQAIGGIFSGMGTDPNTPPVFLLMAVPAWTASRRAREAAARDEAQPSSRPSVAVPSDPAPSAPGRAQYAGGSAANDISGWTLSEAPLRAAPAPRSSLRGPR